ncbi:MAG: alpha/beta hydrolase [Candidatus Omnitrophica bacterium]|nr:alpha/beta hydrolase [Candidatus Omnitrophota bacterium]
MISWTLLIRLAAWSVLGAVGGAWILLLRQTRLPKAPLIGDPGDYLCAFESVRFTATDGVPLAGWFIRQPSSARPVIVVCHGLGTNRSDVLDAAAAFAKGGGYQVLAFDFRGHGESGGRVSSFGYWEQRDLAGALAYLRGRPDLQPATFGVFGISMGGAVAVMTAGRDTGIHAIAADSLFPNLAESIRVHLRLMYPWLAWAVTPLVWLVYWLQFGIWPSAVSPLQSASAIAPRPLLLIHGEVDPRMPLSGARAVFQAAKEPKELWVIPGALHFAGYAVTGEAYHRHILDFFQRALH